MQIHTRHTLCFRISCENPPHDTAIAFVKHACLRTQTPCRVTAMAMPEGAVDHRSSEVRIDGDFEYLSRLSDDLREALTLLGIEAQPCSAE